MEKDNLKFKKKFFIAFAFYLLFSASSSAAAQSQALITWQAQSFAPAEYTGKRLPSPGTNINLGLEVIREKKLRDLSKSISAGILTGNC